MPRHRLCHTSDIANDSARGFNVDGTSVFVVKKFDRLYAYHNRCPHLGVPLEWLPDKFLDTGAELIQCATHGALFVIESGECVAGPCSGQQLRPLALEQHPNGDIVVALQPFSPD